MIRPGDRPENPATGELLVFHRAAAETGGESVLVETIVRPDGFVAAVHVHPHQTFIKGSILTATSKCCKSIRTKKARFPDLLQSPDGLEPSTPSLPWGAEGNRSQPTAKVFAYLSGFRGRCICDGLPPVATAGLHKGSIPRCQS